MKFVLFTLSKFSFFHGKKNSPFFLVDRGFLISNQNIGKKKLSA